MNQTALLLILVDGGKNEQGRAAFTAAERGTVVAAAVITPASGPAVLHADGEFVGGPGRFAGATGTFSVDLIFVNAQGDFVYQHTDPITLQRPWQAAASCTRWPFGGFAWSG